MARPSGEGCILWLVRTTDEAMTRPALYKRAGKECNVPPHVVDTVLDRLMIEGMITKCTPRRRGGKGGWHDEEPVYYPTLRAMEASHD